MPELIELLFGMCNQVGPGNNVLDGRTDPHGKEQFWKKILGHVQNYRHTQHVIDVIRKRPQL